MSDGTHEPTDGRYKNGCRCDGCRAAHRAYTAARRKAALSEGTLSHGVRATYDAGCRCWKCRSARQVDYVMNPGEYQPKGRRRSRVISPP
jgi:hypothetical protein